MIFNFFTQKRIVFLALIGVFLLFVGFWYFVRGGVPVGIDSNGNPYTLQPLSWEDVDQANRDAEIGITMIKVGLALFVFAIIVDLIKIYKEKWSRRRH